MKRFNKSKKTSIQSFPTLNIHVIITLAIKAQIILKKSQINFSWDFKKNTMAKCNLDKKCTGRKKTI